MRNDTSIIREIYLDISLSSGKFVRICRKRYITESIVKAVLYSIFPMYRAAITPVVIKALLICGILSTYFLVKIIHYIKQV